MKRGKRSRARGLWLSILASIFAVALVLYPLRARSAGRAQENGTSGGAHATDAPGKGTKKVVGATKAVKATPATSAAAAEPAAPEAEAEKSPAEGDQADKAKAEGEPTIPVGKGLPVRVDVAVYFLEVTAFDDTKGEWDATVDVRYRWTDPRLAFDRKETLRGYREFLGKAAEEEMAKIWTPTIDVKNRLETGPYVGHRLRIFPDGVVETIVRTTGRQRSHVDPQSFPFDRQKLTLELIVRDATTDEVMLQFDEHDVAFSRAAQTAKLDGWDLGLVDLLQGQVAGWNGDRYATVDATLFVDRQPASSIASVFIPLLASLLIPLLALWMNKSGDDGGFEVDAFELANMGIGGLFSVIALSFAIYSSNPIIASGDNTVTRLFGLNYAALAISLTIVVTFFRYELPKRWFGPYVQEEAFHYLSWAIPLLSLATSAAFIFVAAA